MAKSYPTLTTERGTFLYPHVTEPDTKFVKPHGEYHTKFAQDAEVAAPMIKKLTRILDEYMDEQLPIISKRMDGLKGAKLKKAQETYKRASNREINPLFEDEVDDEAEETGRVIFKFKLKAVVETEKKTWEQKPRLFDGKAQPIEGDVNIWTGSEGKCQIEVFPYFMEKDAVFGLSLRLKAAQVIKLVSGSGASASDCGFGEEEDGYDASGAPARSNDEPFEPDEDGDEEF